MVLHTADADLAHGGHAVRGENWGLIGRFMRLICMLDRTPWRRNVWLFPLISLYNRMAVRLL